MTTLLVALPAAHAAATAPASAAAAASLGAGVTSAPPATAGHEVDQTLHGHRTCGTAMCITALRPLSQARLQSVRADAPTVAERRLVERCSARAVADRFLGCATALGVLRVTRATPHGTRRDRIPLAFVQVWQLSGTSRVVRQLAFVDDLQRRHSAAGWRPLRIGVRGRAGAGSRDGAVRGGRRTLTPFATRSWTVAVTARLDNERANSAGSGITYSLHLRGAALPVATATVGRHAWRCNRTGGGPAGCVSPLVRPVLSLDANHDAALDPVAREIRDAQQAGAPGALGTTSPLRAVAAAASTAHRTADCSGLPADGQFTSCAVYPLVSSQQAAPAEHPVVRALPSAATAAESTAVASFTAQQHILVGDAYDVLATVRTNQAGPRILVVGDSISEGMEGTSTWRYRLSQELTVNGVDGTFVGPWTGTFHLQAPTPSQEPVHDGRYRPGIDFDSANDAQWGWTLNAALPTIESTVATYRPTIILVELGFNDLVFGVSSPAGLATKMQTFVQDARQANPDVAVVVGDVVHRDPATTSASDEALITTYDGDLPDALSEISTSTSPVFLAPLDAGYDAALDSWDGLHPNNVGEFALANAFATSLSGDLGVGDAIPSAAIPTAVVPPQLATPQGLTAVATTGDGVTLSWNHVFGAAGYGLYTADVTAGESLTRQEFAIGADGDSLSGLNDGDLYEFEVRAEFGTIAASPTSSPVYIRASDAS